MPVNEAMFSVMPPPPPSHGSYHAPVGDLLSWRAEIRASIAAVLRLQADNRLRDAAVETALSLQRLGRGEIADAIERRRVAWATYVELYGNSVADRLSPDSDAAGVSEQSLGKRKAIAYRGETEVDDERVSQALGALEDSNLALMEL